MFKAVSWRLVLLQTRTLLQCCTVRGRLSWAELSWAGPEWEDWVEPVWFLPPHFCCLCRVFVPAWQAPTVINSLDHSACPLTQTKAPWRERGWERGSECERQTHTVAYVDTDRQESNGAHRNVTREQSAQAHPLGLIDGRIYEWRGVAEEVYGFTLLGMEFPGQGRGETVSALWTLITHSLKLHLDS